MSQPLSLGRNLLHHTVWFSPVLLSLLPFLGATLKAELKVYGSETDITLLSLKLFKMIVLEFDNLHKNGYNVTNCFVHLGLEAMKTIKSSVTHLLLIK